MSQFQLGKYLFNRKEELERLKYEVFKQGNPDSLVKSKIFKDIIEGELQDRISDVGRLRDSLVRYTSHLVQEMSQTYIAQDSLAE